MWLHFNYNAQMLVNTYKNEQILSLNTSVQYQQCLQCSCYTLTTMPTRQVVINRRTNRQHSNMNVLYQQTNKADDIQVIQPKLLGGSRDGPHKLIQRIIQY